VGDPRTKAEYERRYNANSRVEGFGLTTAQVVPCPFCGAPEWSRWVIAELALNDYKPMREERRCRECGRSARMEVRRDAGSLTSELVQTGGPDPAEYLRPWPRRDDPAGAPRQGFSDPT
jgi:hypothetical protein